VQRKRQQAALRLLNVYPDELSNLF
jgi:hypothetical protein